MEEKHLNPNRINADGKFRLLNIICDVNMILPKDLQLSLSQRAILVDIWSNSDSNYQSIISNKTIALHTGMNQRTAERVISELVRLGWLINVKRRYNNTVVRRLSVPDEIMKLIEEDLTDDNCTESTEVNEDDNRTESTEMSEDNNRTFDTMLPNNEYIVTEPKIHSYRTESTDYNNSNKNSNIIIDNKYKDKNFTDVQLKDSIINYLSIDNKYKNKKQLKTLFDNYPLSVIEKYYNTIKLDKNKFNTDEYYFNTYIKKLNERIEHEEMKIKQMKQKEEIIKMKLESAYFHFKQKYSFDELEKYYSNYEASFYVSEATNDIPTEVYSYFCQM